MIIGVPKEVKLDEYRVAMLPVGVEELTRRGHKVLIEVGAGLGSGLPDTEYAAAGAELALEPAEIFARADMIVKVKEPQPVETAMLREGQVLFTYLHLAPAEEQTQALIHFPQQQPATVRSDPAAVETAHHFPASQGVKFQLRRTTLCVHRPLLLRLSKCLAVLTLCTR